MSRHQQLLIKKLKDKFNNGSGKKPVEGSEEALLLAEAEKATSKRKGGRPPNPNKEVAAVTPVKEAKHKRDKDKKKKKKKSKSRKDAKEVIPVEVRKSARMIEKEQLEHDRVTKKFKPTNYAESSSGDCDDSEVSSEK